MNNFDVTIPDWAPPRVRGLVIQFAFDGQGPRANIPEVNRELNGADVLWIRQFINLVLAPLHRTIESQHVVADEPETFDFPPGLLDSLGYEED